MEDINIGEIEAAKCWFIWIISVRNTNKVEIDTVQMDIADDDLTKIIKEARGRGSQEGPPQGASGDPSSYNRQDQVDEEQVQPVDLKIRNNGA